jgi:futalosine hydrolase
MEGAAFFAGCIDFEADYIQIRAISNYVEKRDKSKWNLPLAIQNLNNELIQLITQL